jgi:hypothetical protein
VKIAVVGSSHAQHVGIALEYALPSSQFQIRQFVTDAATAWKNVSWCGGKGTRARAREPRTHVRGAAFERGKARGAMIGRGGSMLRRTLGGVRSTIICALLFEYI